MKVTDILYGSTQFSAIINECSQFIEESGGSPLFRALPVTYPDMHKVKVRKKKTNSINESFDRAFNEYHPLLRQRAVFTHGSVSDIVLERDTEPFFVYPIDGYKFMYSVNVTNSSQQYQQVFESIIDTVGDTNGPSTISDMLKFTYVHDHISEGIASGAEIVLFNIPYYYAIRVNNENFIELGNIGAV
jgi:hypothetical protein